MICLFLFLNSVPGPNNHSIGKRLSFHRLFCRTYILYLSEIGDLFMESWKRIKVNNLPFFSTEYSDINYILKNAGVRFAYDGLNAGYAQVTYRWCLKTIINSGWSIFIRISTQSKVQMIDFDAYKGFYQFYIIHI